MMLTPEVRENTDIYLTRRSRETFYIFVPRNFSLNRVHGVGNSNNYKDWI